jgi:hypothetical protein
MRINDLPERIRVDVYPEPKTGCWIWIGCVSGSRNGQNKYGAISVGNQRKKVHRIAYEMLKGSIPEGMEIDHLCKNTLCCNPDHLEPVPHSTNCQRGQAGKYQLLKTHCPQGHEYTPENTYMYRNRRTCRICAYEKGKRHVENNRDRVNALKRANRQRLKQASHI